MKKVLVPFVLLSVFTLSFGSCDLVEEVEACVKEFADYQDEAEKYADIEGDVCDNQEAAQAFIDFLENEAKGSCIEEQLEAQDQDLDDIIADAKAELAACAN